MRAILEIGYTKLLMPEDQDINALVQGVAGMKVLKVAAGGRYQEEDDEIRILIVADSAIIPRETPEEG